MEFNIQIDTVWLQTLNHLDNEDRALLSARTNEYADDTISTQKNDDDKQTDYSNVESDTFNKVYTSSCIVDGCYA